MVVPETVPSSGFKVSVSRHSQKVGKFTFGLDPSNSPSLAVLLNPDLLRRPDLQAPTSMRIFKDRDRDVIYLPLFQTVSE